MVLPSPIGPARVDDIATGAPDGRVATLPAAGLLSDWRLFGKGCRLGCTAQKGDYRPTFAARRNREVMAATPTARWTRATTATGYGGQRNC